MEEIKLSNEQNIKNLKKRKILRYIIMVLAFLTIILGILDLFYQRTLLLIITIALFVLVTILQNYRDSIKIIRHDELADIRKEIEDNKKKYKTHAEVLKDEKDEDKKEIVVKEEKKTTPKKTSAAKKTTTSKKKTGAKKTSTTKKKTTNNKKKSSSK